MKLNIPSELKRILALVRAFKFPKYLIIMTQLIYSFPGFSKSLIIYLLLLYSSYAIAQSDLTSKDLEAHKIHFTIDPASLLESP
jgi:hypothetical protein